MSIPKESFPIKDDVETYTKFTMKITLNDAKTQIFWPEQDATEKFIPPIVTMLESELEEQYYQGSNNRIMDMENTEARLRVRMHYFIITIMDSSKIFQ